MTYKKMIYLISNILFVEFRQSNLNWYMFISIRYLYLVNNIIPRYFNKFSFISYCDKYFQSYFMLSKTMETIHTRVDWGLIWYLIYLLVVICLLRVVSIYTHISTRTTFFNTCLVLVSCTLIILYVNVQQPCPIFHIIINTNTKPTNHSWKHHFSVSLLSSSFSCGR
jgi:hypothetical protein